LRTLIDHGKLCSPHSTTKPVFIISDTKHFGTNKTMPYSSSAYANRSINNCNSVNDVISLHAKNSTKMNCKELSFCWNQIAKLVTRNRNERMKFSMKQNQAQFEPLLNCTMSMIKNFGPRNLSSTCHKLVKIRKVCRWNVRNDIWTTLEFEIIRSSEGFDPMGTANVAWALATAMRSSPTVWNKLGAAALHNIHEYNSQDIANTVWACATVGHSLPQLFDKVADVSLPSLHQFNSQALSNTIWAYATVSHSSPQLFDEVAEVALPRLHEFNSREIVNTVLAYAIVDHSSPQLFDKVAEIVLPRLHEFDSQEIANIVWAYAVFDAPFGLTD